LAPIFGFEPLKSEEEIPASFLTNYAAKKFKDHSNRIYAKLKRYMHIVKVFDDETLPVEDDEIEDKKGKDVKAMAEALKLVFTELNEFRNDYTHYYSLEKGTIRKTEVSDALKTFLNTCYKWAIGYTSRRFKDVFTEKDFEIAHKAV